MGMYPGLQPLSARFRIGESAKYKNMDIPELEKAVFPEDPELFARLAFRRGEGIPWQYRRACKKPVDKKMVFFESNLGRQWTGNPRYIYERMLERYPDYTYVWGYDGDPDSVDGNTIVVKRSTDEYYEYLAKSHYLVNNTGFPIWFHRTESFYLQTWHGTPYKSLHWDRKSDHPLRGTSGNFFAKSTGWNALLAPNAWSKERFRTCFRYRGPILDIGYPANDIFFDTPRYEKVRARMRQELGIPAESPVYLYAPTWRDGGLIAGWKFKFDLLLDPEEFMKHVPDDAYLLIRAHHMSDADGKLVELPNHVIDVSGYDDAHEVMCTADVMIADYSSIAHDWYCSRKPVVYFVPDLERYMSLRDVYYDMTSKEYRAGEICYNQDELHKQIESIDPFALTSYTEYYDRFCASNDGHASDRAIDFMLSK
ncbi:MAG: CDP-glycerol glycerophosphotransferase family protein [Coriobacteriales bacterium]|jgi:CDP-glycerol glycerophosphotransferase (TagB/SpsB family)